MYKALAYFDSIVIVESLPAGDFKSGTELFERTIAPAAVGDTGLLAELYEPRGKEDFLGVLTRLQQIAERHGRAPIIQLETHGSPEGITVADGDRISWDELVAPLAAVNEACRMNLIVIAGLCHGWSMIDILRPTVRAPVFAMVGPMKEVKAGSLLVATQNLYEELLKPGHDMRKALRCR